MKKLVYKRSNSETQIDTAKSQVLEKKDPEEELGKESEMFGGPNTAVVETSDLNQDGEGVHIEDQDENISEIIKTLNRSIETMNSMIAQAVNLLASGKLEKQTMPQENEMNNEENMQDELVKKITDDDFIEKVILKNDKIKNAIILDYLKSMSRPNVNLLTSNSGNSFKAPQSEPKSLEEAKRIVEMYY